MGTEFYHFRLVGEMRIGETIVGEAVPPRSDNADREHLFK